MVKKGLCITCVNDKTCTFPRKFPVWQCEEFCEYVPSLIKNKSVNTKRSSLCEEDTEAE